MARGEAQATGYQLGGASLERLEAAGDLVDPGHEIASSFDRRLRRSLVCVKAILDTSPDGVVVVGRDRRITYVNPAVERLLRHSKEEIVGQTVDRYLHRCECLDQIAAALRPDRPVLGKDVELRRRDGTVIRVSLSASLLRPDGTDMGAVAYLRDVSERRQTEENLARSNAQLEHYADAVSHDLRSPLVSLLGFSRLLRRDHGEGIDPIHHERIFEIFQSPGRSRDGRRGTGIGLAIVKKIVETHGGRVWVESDLGEGASFHLTLPAD